MRSVLCVVVATALVAAACAGSDPEPTGTAATPVGPTTDATLPPATSAPTPAAPVVEAAVIEIDARSVVYGGVIFRPVEAEISNEDPTSRENGLDLPSTDTYLHLTIGVQNPMIEATLTLDHRRFFGLRIGDTITPAPLLSDDIAPRSAVRPGVEGTMRVSWEVPEDFTLEDGALVVGPEESQQAVLPLAGLALATGPRLRAVPVDLTGQVAGTTVCGATRLRVVDPLVTLSVDLPADVVDTGGLPRRALAGQTFVEVGVELEVLAVDGSDGCTGTVISDDLVAIADDGGAPLDGWVDGSSSVVADVGETVALTVGAMVRVGAQVLVTVGEPGGDTVTATFTAD